MADGIPYWDTDWEVWDRLKIDNKVVAGRWTIESGNVKRVFDIKKGPGRDGAIVRDMGYENGALVLVGQIGDGINGAQEWADLQRTILQIRPNVGKRRKPIEIEHPIATYLGIRRVNVTEIDVPRIDNGILTQTIRVLEYIPQISKVKNQKSEQASLEAALARQDTQTSQADVARRENWTNEYLTTDQTSNMHKANAEFQWAQQSGAVPEFSFAKPRYTPAPPTP